MGSCCDLRVLPVCMCCLAFNVLILICVMVPLSVRSLDQGKYALLFDWVQQNVRSEPVTEPGMKTVGLGNGLLEYPSTYQTMYFVQGQTRRCNGAGGDASCNEVWRPYLKARSADGLEMLVGASFQWRLTPSSLLPLYRILGEDLYKDEFVRFARQAIWHACSKYPAEMYFTNRTQITAEMFDRLVEVFNRPDKGLYVEIKDVQLREVDMPDEFNEEIANTQEQQQELEIAMAEREQQKVAKEREILVATEGVVQAVEEAKGAAEKTLVYNQADVDRIINLNTKQATANNLILQNFASDSEPFQRLFEIMKLKALQEHNST